MKNLTIIEKMLIFVLLFPFPLPCLADGNCEFVWKSGNGVGGLNGTVNAVTTWDPDGIGPQKEVLVAGGEFTMAGGVSANHIAIWNGNTWQALGTGVSVVSALTVYDGELIAGGRDEIARWDGSAWQSLGGGTNGTVRALTVYNSELIAGGHFTITDGETIYNIARWNGSSWQPLGDGINRIIYALTTYNGNLVAGGYTTTGDVSQWNGNTWQPLGEGMGMDGAVCTLTVYNGELIAGGSFTTADELSVNHITQWNGSSWRTLGSGMNGDVYSLTVFNGELIAGGEFATAGGVNARNVARWDGSTWNSIGVDVYLNGRVSAITVYDDQLIIGGFEFYYSCISRAYILSWDGNSGSWWKALGGHMNFSNTFAVYNGKLVTACGFAGCVASGQMISQWDGSSWQEFPCVGCAHVLTVYNGELIAGGNNDCSNPYYALNRWNGDSWQELGYAADVFALTVYNGNLIAGGWMLLMLDEAPTPPKIAQWDGSNWLGLGTGIDFEVHALTVHENKLIAGGIYFPLEDGNIASWDGDSWQYLGNATGGISGMWQETGIYALTTYNEELIVGGVFDTIGGISASYIARWDGNNWYPLGSGMDAPVYALTVYNGELIAGGEFSNAGGESTNNIARWNGISWQPLDHGMDDWVQALIVYNGELIAGGNGIKRWGKPNPIVGDLNHDCSVDSLDLETLCERWLDDDCMYSAFCGEADLDYNFKFDLADFALFSAHWLE